MEPQEHKHEGSPFPTWTSTFPRLTGSQRSSPSQAASPQSRTKQLQPLAHNSSPRFLFEELRLQVETETRFRQAKPVQGNAHLRCPLPPSSWFPKAGLAGSSHRLPRPLPNPTLTLAPPAFIPGLPSPLAPKAQSLSTSYHQSA